MTRFFLCLCLVFYALTLSPAQAGLIEFLFPSLKKQEEDPSQTLQAPFADKKAQSDHVPLKSGTLPENAIALDQPHRNTSQIMEWVINATAGALTFNQTNTDELATKQASFATSGYTQYEQFLTTNNIKKVVESGQYTIRSYVNDSPLLLNEGAANGTYHWLYQVPVVISYMNRTNKDYKGGGTATNQKMMITVQVGRSATTEDKMGLVIETWAGKVEKIDKR